MAASTPTYNELRQSISRGKLAPVYLLHGEEGFYIDRLVSAFEELVPEDERDFNLFVLYGPETTPEAVVECCHRYPMMAERVVVILKEAQSMRADALNRLHGYVESPNQQCVLVIVSRGAQAKGKDLLAAMRKGANVIFESKKLKDQAVLTVIADLVKSKGMHIEPKVMMMLRDFIGTDVSRLYNEIDKLALILGPGATVTPESIELHIGISKDFNNFELLDALATRNAEKAFRIVNYFRSNPKNNPVTVTVATLFNYFANLLTMQFCPDKSPAAMSAACGFKSQWQMRSYEPALKAYNAWQSMEIIGAIRDTECMTKGIGSRQDPYALLYDLTYRILTAPGRISIK